MKKKLLRLTDYNKNEVLVNLANVTMITVHDSRDDMTKICLCDGNIVYIDSPFEDVARQIPEACYAYVE